ncbi:uncharacterized protein MONOS_3297 [Monocercomonoides exilis]|uniref:uncharacterized protein n=1 Tax=Monocercomonoides exilis TaxID=2049356 RepID=UPI00355A7DE4|nr:hypothetical protein MONOS_3297 [Monocercomonoides exilis]|eukprot:MONOS_3297.1-p1 / transcript=MONOS_3297.1 / gene=MONOS_3297 / organism=Monocercomonoides_exilis_PA203 / gene_product=unspecified product / transcript_product=unspecified product / location=Mono_scaffold00076:110227-111699(-) / protein_length=227 / sequence_SO=supercontig / SO=protein_coding / is_pseudo=false
MECEVNFTLGRCPITGSRSSQAEDCNSRNFQVVSKFGLNHQHGEEQDKPQEELQLPQMDVEYDSDNYFSGTTETQVTDAGMLKERYYRELVDFSKPDAIFATDASPWACGATLAVGGERFRFHKQFNRHTKEVTADTTNKDSSLKQTPSNTTAAPEQASMNEFPAPGSNKDKTKEDCPDYLLQILLLMAAASMPASGWPRTKHCSNTNNDSQHKLQYLPAAPALPT